MTTPPPDDQQDVPDAADAPIDDDRLAALRALLRDEPVDTDPAATETRILAALDAAADEPMRLVSDAPAVTGRRPGPHTTTRVAPARRGWSARPVLVAAALLAVVGIGAVVWGSADRDAEFMASAGDAATAEATIGVPGDEAGGAADGGSVGDSDDDADAIESADPTSTLAPAPAAAAAGGALVDLGDFDSVERLLRDGPDDLLERLPDEQVSGAERSTQFDQRASAAVTCAAQRSSSGDRVLGIATVVGTAVLVVEADGSRALFELPPCRPLP
ncbi:MAG: hypothetical protein ACK4V6_00940 [Microthrixaceae bacterium]